VLGIVHQAGGATADLSGIFTAEFVGLNPQQTLALATGGSNSTYSANLSLAVTGTSVPEPASVFLSAIGMIALGLVKRVRRSAGAGTRVKHESAAPPPSGSGLSSI